MISNPSHLLWRLAGDHADVGYRLTFLHRGHGADIQDHSARRRTRFPHRLAEQVGDVADFHALLHVPAALDRGIENAGGFAGDAGNALDPERGLSARTVRYTWVAVGSAVADGWGALVL